MFIFISLIGALISPTTHQALSNNSFIIYACTSSTGRTQLNVFQDHYPHSFRPYVVRLIIDGQLAEFIADYNDPKDRIEHDKEKDAFSVFENDQLVLTFTKKRNSILIKKGFLDPRKGTEFTFNGDNKSDIDTHCRLYEGD